MIYVDWRPVAAEAISPQILYYKEFDFRKKNDCNAFRSAAKIPLRENEFLIELIIDSVILIGYGIRVDGIFAFFFEEKQDSADRPSANAEMLSYAIKSISGHVHQFDESPLNFFEERHIKHKILSRKPVQVGNCQGNTFLLDAVEQEKGEIEEEIIDGGEDGIKYILGDGNLPRIYRKQIIGGHLYKEIAILGIRREFSRVFDYTKAWVSESGYRWKSFSLFPALLLLVAIIYISNIFGKAFIFSIQNPEKKYEPFLAILTLHILIPTVIAGILFISNIVFGRGYFVNIFYARMRHLSRFKVTEKFVFLIKHEYGRYIRKYIYSYCAANNFSLYIFVCFFTIIVIYRYANIFPFFGLPTYEGVRSLLSLDTEALWTPWAARVIALGVLTSFTVHFISKQRKFRREKLVAWDKCYGFMLFACIFDKVARRVVGYSSYQETGFQFAKELSLFFLKKEERKKAVDLAVVFFFWISCFVILTLFEQSYSR